MDCAEDVTSHHEATQFVSRELDIVTLARSQPAYPAYSLIEIVGYRESVGLCVIVYDMNDDGLLECDIHDWPWIAMGFATVVADIDSFIRHYNCEGS